MISEQEAEKAAEYIRTIAPEYAKAKSQRVYLDEYRKSLKAIKMQEKDGTDKTRESYAYSHNEYLDNIKALSAAVEAEETIRWKMVAARAKIDLYQTQSANNRAIDRVHR